MVSSSDSSSFSSMDAMFLCFSFVCLLDSWVFGYVVQFAPTWPGFLHLKQRPFSWHLCLSLGVSFPIEILSTSMVLGSL